MSLSTTRSFEMGISKGFRDSVMPRTVRIPVKTSSIYSRRLSLLHAAILDDFLLIFTATVISKTSEYYPTCVFSRLVRVLHFKGNERVDCKNLKWSFYTCLIR